MLTRNFKTLKKLENMGGYGYFYDITGGYKSCNFAGGYLEKYRSFIAADLMLANCGSISTNGVYFGTGTAPATENDNTLESPITEGLSISLPSSVLRAQNDGSTTYSATYTIGNNSGAEVIISEIGLFTKLTGGTNSTIFYVMMDRTVLEEPVTIAAGETKVLTYQMRFGTIYA